ncbi:MAG: stage II sporulation protein M [Candidatus Woesearchaeota archaeon]
MVLEYILGPKGAERRPWLMIPIGLIYTFLAYFIANAIFPEHAGLVMVFLITIASVPVIYDAIKIEERQDLEEESEVNALIHHWRALLFFICLFIGFLLGFSILYSVLPLESAKKAFSIQIEVINAINTPVSGKAVTDTSSSLAYLITIFVNNFKVVLFCLLFSFVYGMGAIFILAWNASTMGVAIGSFIRITQEYLRMKGMPGPVVYAGASVIGLLRYSIHGILEMLAYFIGGLAGGIISVAIVKHDFSTKGFERIILDASDLLIIAVLVLVVAALLEVYVTPLLFS